MKVYADRRDNIPNMKTGAANLPPPPQCDPPRSGFNLTGELSVKLKSTGFHTDAFLPDYKSGLYSNILRGNDVSPRL